MTPSTAPEPRAADGWHPGKGRPVPDAAGPRERLREAIRQAAAYSADDGTQGWLLSEDQFAAILAHADEYAAALVQLFARPSWPGTEETS